jgi:hypothetical protein
LSQDCPGNDLFLFEGVVELKGQFEQLLEGGVFRVVLAEMLDGVDERV